MKPFSLVLESGVGGLVSAMNATVQKLASFILVPCSLHLLDLEKLTSDMGGSVCLGGELPLPCRGERGILELCR